MKLIYSISDAASATISEVGGKGFSLIRMVQYGLNVPSGFVLTVAFFEPWLKQLKTTNEWKNFLESDTEQLKKNCNALKALTFELELTGEQKQLLNDSLSAYKPEQLFAVRSSAPEEDLAGASFAGGYETILGVNSVNLESAIRRAFASCLDVRVVVYKKEHGFNYQQPKIAVVIQEQIASEIAGVGFSINPVDNNYDQAVFNANWGLGETVVAGIASPDHFVVDKFSNEIIEKKLGKKETSIWLTSNGGTEEHQDSRHSQLCLTGGQIFELMEQLIKIEKLYEQPMDIEWAFAENKLYLLQARPITTYYLLPEDLISKAGAKKRLYLDVLLTIQGLVQPLSVMGTSVIAGVFSTFSKTVLGKDITQNIDSTLPYASGGRMYVNLSNVLVIADKDKLEKIVSNMDTITASIIKGIKAEEYRADNSEIKKLPLHLLWHLPDIPLKVIEAGILPEHASHNLHKEIERKVAELKAIPGKNLNFAEFTNQIFNHVVDIVFHNLLPYLLTSRVAIGKIQTLFDQENQDIKKQLEYLDRSLPGNITIEMGLDLYHLSVLLDQNINTIEQFQTAFLQKTISTEFNTAWEKFLTKFGFRGPRELDIAAPRFRDQPGLLLQQILQLKQVKDPEQTPLSIFQRSQNERHQAFEYLGEIAHMRGWLQSKKFNTLYKIIETFGGIRETPKYYLIMAIDFIRQRVLKEAEALVSKGRLENIQQVFDLTLNDLNLVLNEPGPDISKIILKNRAYLDKIRNTREFPRVIDSRGKILQRQKPPVKEGEISGQPISSGIVKGTVKVLHSPDEKILLPGDILVAHATDPGWTPLFVNASAILLEVGGMLQHGALVAREYGKPCIAGLENITDILKDGMQIEVDGSSGIITIIK